jgi:hypothetical protein
VLNNRFHNAIDALYEKHHHLAGQVSKLGYPSVVDKHPPTAAVAWDPDKKKIKFLLNKNFCDRINDEEFRFVVAHEAVHMFSGHVFFLKTKIDEMKNANTPAQEVGQFCRKFAIAADCVVNDSLVNLYGLKHCEFLNEKGETSIYYGKNIVGCDCHNLSIANVMMLIPDQQSQEGDPGHSFWDSFFNKDGSINKDFINSMSDIVEENQQNSSMSQEDIEKLEKLKEAMQQCSDKWARQAGHAESSSSRSIRMKNSYLMWERIFFHKNDRKKVEDTWARRSRKLSAFPQDLLLPSTVDKEIEDIFVAIDVSGSINRAMVDVFVSVVRNVPKHFHINAITFNTQCHPFDIKSDEVPSGGGTRFDIIEKYIQKTYKRYPKCVLVLTDGCGNAVVPQYPSRWIWMLYGDLHTNYCKDMTWHKMQELLK